MKKPFKLKSGNISGGASFKAMGATPGESPMDLNLLKKYKQGKKVVNNVIDWFTGTPSTKTIAKSDKTKKSVSKVKSKVTKDKYKKEANVENMVETIVDQSSKRNLPTRAVKGVRDLFIADQITGGHGTDFILSKLGNVTDEVELKSTDSSDDKEIHKTIQKRKKKEKEEEAVDTTIEIQ